MPSDEQATVDEVIAARGAVPRCRLCPTSRDAGWLVRTVPRMRKVVNLRTFQAKFFRTSEPPLQDASVDGGGEVRYGVWVQDRHQVWTHLWVLEPPTLNREMGTELQGRVQEPLIGIRLTRIQRIVLNDPEQKRFGECERNPVQLC